MPFQGNVYYPYSRDAHGTHSSAGIPSLLNSPLSQHCAPGMTPTSGVSTAPPFRFRPRRESVDWRRIVSVDIDVVVSQVDVDTLQEHINAVTFCSLDSERCPRCQSPVDPPLIKLLRLAQLSVEWLLHCQEFLTLNLHAMEDRLEAAGKDREQLLAKQKTLEEKIKTLNGELKQRKKIIHDQQLMIAPGISSKCQHCDKFFMNGMFLQKHMERRHPEEYDKQVRSDSKNKLEIERLRSENTNLKEQIVHLQQVLQTKAVQEKEQESLHREILRELDRFKAEEMARVDRKFEDNREGMRREMEFMCNRNIQALNVANQQQPTKPGKSSPVQLEPEKDENSYQEMYQKAMNKLQQLRKKHQKWESRLQKVNAQHESEQNQLRNELNTVQMRSEIQRQEFGRKLQEKEQTIKSQKEQMKTVASNKPAKVVETRVLQTSTAPEPKPKKVVIEEPTTVLMLDPIQELSEEGRESSSVSEAKEVQKKTERVPEKKHRPATSGLRKEHSLRELRLYLEESLIRSQESYGVKASCCGLKDNDFNSLMKKVQLERDRTAQKRPDYWSCQEEIKKVVQEKLERNKGGIDQRDKAKQVVQFRSRSSSLPARAAHVRSALAEKHPKTPLPAPRSKSVPQPRMSTPKNKTHWRGSSNSDEEESEEDEEDETDTEDELHHDQKNKPGPVQNRVKQATPLLTRQASVSSNNSPPRGVPSGVTKTAITNVDSDDEEDWSEVSELEEIDPERLHSYKDQNGNLEKKDYGKANKVSEIAKKMENRFIERLVKKPAGGISILPVRNDEVLELSCTDLEESNEWASSSLEEKQQKAKPTHNTAPLRKSLDSASTSVWGTSAGKGPRSSLTEASTGSTLKSNLFSLSDISDDDFS